MADTKTKKKFHIGLAVKLCALIVIICIAATVIISVINYQKYLEAVYNVHSKYAAEMSALVKYCMTDEQWQDYSDILYKYRADEIGDDEVIEMEESDSFQSAYDMIQQVVDAHNLENLTVFILDKDAMDNYTEENFDLENSDIFSFLMEFYPSDSDNERYMAGNQDYWWGNYEDFNGYRDIFNYIYENKEDYCTNEILANGGMYLTDYYPVIINDKVVALIGLSSDAIQIEGFMQSFFIETFGIGLAVAAGLIILALILIYLRIVWPLKLIKKESEAFIKNTEDNESSSDGIIISEKLVKVKTRDEIQDLAESFLKMEIDIKEFIHQITSVTAEKERISTELNVATKIQEDMLPGIFPAFPERSEFDIYATMDPAKEVGGDFYDFFFIDETHFGMVIADVAGKGVPAALFMVIAKTLIKNRTLMGGNPAEILEYVNTQLCENNETNMFVTVWMAIIDLESGKGMAANAGHEHPVRKDKGCEYELIQYRHSPAVASFEGIPFRQHAFELHPGDRLFVYTDGLPEATNIHDELYGTDRILNVLNNNKELSINEVLEVVKKDVDEFVGEAPQFDDLTMLIFEYYGPKPES